MLSDSDSEFDLSDSDDDDFLLDCTDEQEGANRPLTPLTSADVEVDFYSSSSEIFWRKLVDTDSLRELLQYLNARRQPADAETLLYVLLKVKSLEQLLTLFRRIRAEIFWPQHQALMPSVLALFSSEKVCLAVSDDELKEEMCALILSVLVFVIHSSRYNWDIFFLEPVGYQCLSFLELLEASSAEERLQVELLCRKLARRDASGETFLFRCFHQGYIKKFLNVLAGFVDKSPSNAMWVYFLLEAENIDGKNFRHLVDDESIEIFDREIFSKIYRDAVKAIVASPQVYFSFLEQLRRDDQLKVFFELLLAFPAEDLLVVLQGETVSGKRLGDYFLEDEGAYLSFLQYLEKVGLMFKMDPSFAQNVVLLLKHHHPQLSQHREDSSGISIGRIAFEWHRLFSECMSLVFQHYSANPDSFQNDSVLLGLVWEHAFTTFMHPAAESEKCAQICAVLMRQNASRKTLLERILRDFPNQEAAFQKVHAQYFSFFRAVETRFIHQFVLHQENRESIKLFWQFLMSDRLGQKVSVSFLQKLEAAVLGPQLALMLAELLRFSATLNKILPSCMDRYTEIYVKILRKIYSEGANFRRVHEVLSDILETCFLCSEAELTLQEVLSRYSSEISSALIDLKMHLQTNSSPELLVVETNRHSNPASRVSPKI